MLRYYQELATDKIAVIQAELQAHARSLGYFDLKPRYLVNHLDTLELEASCPTFSEFFRQQGFKIITASYYIAEARDTSDMHVDHGVRRARISVPVINTEHSSTVFYRVKPELIKYHTLPNGTVYYRCMDPNAQAVASITITQPTVLNIKEPHDVIVTQPGIRRIAITVGTNPDPVYLLEDHQ